MKSLYSCAVWASELFLWSSSLVSHHRIILLSPSPPLLSVCMCVCVVWCVVCVVTAHICASTHACPYALCICPWGGQKKDDSILFHLISFRRSLSLNFECRPCRFGYGGWPVRFWDLLISVHLQHSAGAHTHSLIFTWVLEIWTQALMFMLQLSLHLQAPVRLLLL